MPSEERATIAILGGTGNLGFGLARRWAGAGYQIVIGSRVGEKAEAAAARIGLRIPGGNLAAAAEGSIVVIAVPYANHDAILGQIKAAVAGKIVVDVVVPLKPPKVSVVQLPPEGSAAVAAQRILGDDARVVSAFHNVSADKLQSSEPVDCDVLVFGDDTAARQSVVELAGAAGLRGIHAGALANSAAAEALTSVLISINRRHKITSAGIRITGLPAFETG